MVFTIKVLMDEMRKTILFCKGCVTNQLAFKILLTALDSSANEVATQEVKRKKKNELKAVSSCHRYKILRQDNYLIVRIGVIPNFVFGIDVMHSIYFRKKKLELIF